jgi:8-oxo-dGTP pyrophosphatase MutT (NUDIX family)
LPSSRAQQLIQTYEAILRPRITVAPLPAATGQRCAAVFVLFIERNGEAEILLMRRPRLRGKHRGEWAFPGGMREPGDGDLLQTAFRETEEELGITPSAIDYWGPLDPVSTVGTQFSVWAFTGLLDPTAKIVPSAVEVEEISRFPIDTFTSLSMRRSIQLRRGGQMRDLRAYVHDGMVVWGATARILSQIFDPPSGASDAESDDVAEGLDSD